MYTIGHVIVGIPWTDELDLMVKTLDKEPTEPPGLVVSDKEGM